MLSSNISKDKLVDFFNRFTQKHYYINSKSLTADFIINELKLPYAKVNSAKDPEFYGFKRSLMSRFAFLIRQAKARGFLVRYSRGTYEITKRGKRGCIS